MHAIDFIQDLAVIMLIAGFVTILCHRFKQPVVLGYIIAGVIIGPHTPPFALVHDEQTIKTLAELGVIFLMFCLGLEFSLRKLFQVGATAFIAAFLEITLMIWAGFEIGRLFDWNTMDSLFLGAILAMSSTTIIIKVLGDLKLKNERFAQLIFGVLIIEDILGIGIIALFSGIAVSGTVEADQVVSTVGKLSLFMVVALVVGILLVPRLLAYVAKFESNEMLLVTVLGLCFGFCLLVVKLEYSMVLGAFLIGAIMAESRQLGQIERLIEPVRDMFSSIFFVAIGLLIDPGILVEYAWPIVVITLAVVLGKMVSCGLGAFIAGNDGRTSLRVGMGLSQIGEFSFIIAALGITLQVTSDFLYPVAVAVSAITTLLTPYLIRAADPLSIKLAKAMPRPLARVFGYYGDWLRSIQPQGQSAVLAGMIRKILLQVTPDVLTPRPDTETVVEYALRDFPEQAPWSVLDLGVGSGAILLSILAERPAARGLGVDVSEEALAVARENAANLGLASRTALMRGDWTVGLADDSFDLVVSNPPYVASDVIAGLEPEVRDFDPRLALDGGADGLDAYRVLAPEILRVLKPAGMFAVEIDYDQSEAVEALFKAAGAQGVRTVKDLSTHDRVVTGVKNPLETGA